MTLTRKMIPLVIVGLISLPACSDQSEPAEKTQAKTAAAAPTTTASGTPAASKKAVAEVKIDAKAQLAGMAKRLASAKQFSVTIDMRYDVVQSDGQKIQFSEMRKVQISRPNKLRVDSQQSNGASGGLIFDGKTLTLFSTAQNVYSQVEQPGDADAAIRYAVGKLGIRVPLARLLVTSLPQELDKLNLNVEYVERNTLGGVVTHHIAAQASGVDFQVWINDDQLPSRIILTYKNEPGQPQFYADFSDWNLATAIAESTFSFTPEKDAEKIKTLLPVRKSAAASKTTGGAK